MEETRELLGSDGAGAEWHDRSTGAKFGNLILDRLPAAAVPGGSAAGDVFCSSLLSRQVLFMPHE